MRAVASEWARDDPFGSIVRAATRRPLVTIGVVALLAVAGGLFALRLDTSTSIDTLVDRDSETFEATEQAKSEFGDDAIVILAQGDLQRTLLTPDLGRLRDLEQCLAGQLPPDRLPTLPAESRATCDELAANRPVKVVYGPGTFITQASDALKGGLEQRLAEKDATAEEQARVATELAREQGLPKQRQEELAQTAREAVDAQFNQTLAQLAVRYNITRPPAINDPSFVSQLVFDTARGVNAPKAKFAYLFPSSQAALIQVRLRPDLSQSERERAIALVQDAASQPRFAPQRGASLTVTGVPVVVSALADSVQDSLVILLVAGILVMAGTLAVVFRSRLRLLPLAIALAAAALTYAAVSLAGGSLTMASIAALPVLIGLAVDYAIQFQSRFNEVRGAAREPPPAAVAAPAAATAGAPTIAAAGVATAAGFLVLLLSPVPMVRGFALILIVGVALALACALTAGFAALVRFSDGRRRPDDVPPAFPRLRRSIEPVGAGVRRVGRGLAASPPGRGAQRASSFAGERRRRTLAFAVRRPQRVLAIGLALAALGWVLDTQTEVVSDVRELAPQGTPALEDLERLQAATGVAGELDVTVSGENVTDPEVIEWMAAFQRDVLAEHGYTEGATCSQATDPPELCPALSLPDLLTSQNPDGSAAPIPANVGTVLDAVPPYFQQAVISPDRNVANLAFGIRLMSLEDQHELVQDIEERLDPPPGVEAAVTGLPVLAAEGNADLSSSLRRTLTLVAGLLAVFLVLLAIRRRPRAAAIPLIPIALSSGWAVLVLFLLQIPLNPMSASLGALVIAISTEFSVLLSARYQEERAAGAAPRAAIDLAYGSTGAAVLASGATAIAGFAVLILSPIRMLWQFGAVTVVGLTVSLIGVMIVLPAALVWAEEHGPFTLRDLDPRGLVRRLGRAAREIDLPALRRRLPSQGRLRTLRESPPGPRFRRRRTRA